MKARCSLTRYLRTSPRVNRRTPAHLAEPNHDERPKASTKNNSSFILNCLAGLAIAGGATLIVAAVILAQPELAALGIAIASVGIVRLGIFAEQNRERKEPEFDKAMSLSL